MADTSVGGGAASAAPTSTPFSVRDGSRVGLALVVVVAILLGAYVLQDTPGQGARAAFSLLVGAVLGLTFQRGRFCFFCILRDYIEFGNSGPIYSILAALAVGGIGYAIVFGAFLPNTMSGRLPPDAHIGPVSWVVVAA